MIDRVGTRADLRDPATLLDAWEAAAGAPGHRRGPALLAAIGEATPGESLDVPLDELAEALTRHHVTAFGSPAAGLITCPACTEILEVDADLAALFPPRRTGGSAGTGTQADRAAGPGHLVVRTPTARDLIAAAAAADPAAEVVRRCVWSADGTPCQLADLGPEDLAAVDEELERRAGPGLPVLSTACPGCGEQVIALVDPATLLWAEVRSSATVLIQDVADLAAAFGWREDDVLALPGWRRAAYLELARR
jgi:hypothetical protein